MSIVDVERMLEANKSTTAVGGSSKTTADPLQDALTDELGDSKKQEPKNLSKRDIDAFIALAKAAPDAPPATKQQRKALADLLRKATHYDFKVVRFEMKKAGIDFRMTLKAWSTGKAPAEDKALYIRSYQRALDPAAMEPHEEVETVDEPVKEEVSAPEPVNQDKALSLRKLYVQRRRAFNALTELLKTETDPERIKNAQALRKKAYVQMLKIRAQAKKITATGE